MPKVDGQNEANGDHSQIQTSHSASPVVEIYLSEMMSQYLKQSGVKLLITCAIMHTSNFLICGGNMFILK